MPYPEHTLIAWGGSWDSRPEEEWACTLRMSGWVSPLSEDQEDILTAVRTSINGFHSGSSVPAEARLQWVKCNPINADGKYMSNFTANTHVYETPIAGGNSVTVLPFQNTVAVSLLTTRQRGIASRGRFFPPGVGTNELTVGILTNARQAVRATAAKNLIESLNDVGDTWGLGVVSVVSQGANQGTGTGVAVPVVKVSIGVVVDTQRRRRNQQSESPRVETDIV